MPPPPLSPAQSLNLFLLGLLFLQVFCLPLPSPLLQAVSTIILKILKKVMMALIVSTRNRRRATFPQAAAEVTMCFKAAKRMTCHSSCRMMAATTARMKEVAGKTNGMAGEVCFKERLLHQIHVSCAPRSQSAELCISHAHGARFSLCMRDTLHSC
jgi:hypothetical protein